MRRRRLIRARNMQPRNDPTRLLAERNEHALATAIYSSFKALQQHAVENHLLMKADERASNFASRLISGDAVHIAVETATQGLDQVGTESAYQQAVRQAQAAGLTVTRESILTTALHTALNAYRADLVRQVSDDTIEAITEMIQRGLDAGDRYDRIVSDIRPLIGLTTQQMQAAESFRQGLIDLDGSVMSRAWRDRRFDSTLQDALDSGQSLSDDYIDRMVDAYAEKALTARATAISRTETLRAANLGAHEGIRAFVESRGMETDAIKRYWQVMLDEVTCPVCMSIPDLNPDGVGYDEDFEVDNDEGSIDIPPVHPNCRCTVISRIDPVALEAYRQEQEQAA